MHVFMASDQRRSSSVSLFLATVGMAAGGLGLPAGSVIAAESAIPMQTAALLAQATQECVPIGEGENCSGPRRRRGRSLLPQETNSGSTPNNPAADAGNPTANPGAQSGSAKDELNQIERGNL